MYRNILVGFSNDAQGRDALELGRILAQACDAQMLVAPASADDGRQLAQIAREEEADLVVLGSTHEHLVGRAFSSATVGRLLGDSCCAVAVAPPGFCRPQAGGLEWRPLSGAADDPGLRVIGVGYDGSPSSAEALRAAAELAVANGAALRVYAVAQGAPSDSLFLAEKLQEAVSGLPDEARALPVLAHADPALALIDAANTGVDLMVLGSRPGGPVRRVLHGSVSNAVMREASCPVLISPSGVAAAAPVPAWMADYTTA